MDLDRLVLILLEWESELEGGRDGQGSSFEVKQFGLQAFSSSVNINLVCDSISICLADSFFL